MSASSAHGAIVTSGDVQPPYPITAPDPWNAGLSLSVGHTFNGSLEVNSGSNVIDLDGYIGFWIGAAGSVTITDDGSTWENKNNLYLGRASSGGVGSLHIQNRGTVIVGDAISSGGPGPSRNLHIGDTDASGTSGGHLYIYGGSTLSNDYTAIIGMGPNEYGWVTLDGAGSTWFEDGLIAGWAGQATLRIQNGGSLVNSGAAELGYSSGGLTSTATVTGNGSSWTNNWWLNVDAGTLTIEDGGTVFCGAFSRVGEHNLGSTVAVNGNGSTWEVAGDLRLYGWESYSHGVLSIADGGTVYVGDAARSGGLPGWLTVSDSAVGGRLLINGTLDHYGSAILGDHVGEFGHAVLSAPDSSWTNGGDLLVGLRGEGLLQVAHEGRLSNGEWLVIGQYGSGTMTVESGARVSNTDGRLGHYTGASGTATVDGTDSTWESTRDLSLGRSGGVGSLTITNEGTVYVGDAASSGGWDGILVVSDTDGSGTNGGHVHIYHGSTITNHSHSIVGNNTGESGWAEIRGAGSSWTNEGSLFIGYSGSGTQVVEDGGTVSNIGGFIGYSGPGATGTVTVTDSGSIWENTGNLTLGRSFDSGVGALNVSNGGTVYVGDAASSGGRDDCLVVSDVDPSGLGGGHLYVYNGSTINHASFAIVGDDVGEHGWATVDGSGTSWTNSESLVVGYAGSGTLIVQNGGVVSNADGWIGFNTGSAGTATVDGAGSQWINNGPLLVGFNGSGALNVQNGGIVSATDGLIGYWTGGSGSVTITDSGSTWENTLDLSLGDSANSGVGSLTVSGGGTVYVGDAARSGGASDALIVSDSDASGSAGGHVYLYNGSTLNQTGFAILGDDAGEHGWATVHGAGSSWDADESLAVGFSGSGTLTVQDGGQVSNADGWIGFNMGAAGAATVDGTGSSWTNNGPLGVGFSGAGMLQIKNGGSVSATGDGLIGYATDGVGTVLISGIGSSWSNGGGLYVATLGTGTITVWNGGKVTTAQMELGGSGTGPDTGILVVDDGAVDVTGSLAIEETGRVDFSDGMISAQTIDDPYGNFNWTGGRLAIGTFQGDLDNPSGDLVPGVSPGLARVTGDYMQGGNALLEMEIEGPVPTVGHDQLRVVGDVQLDGMLDLVVSDTLPLDVGETFLLIDALGDVTGKFARINGVIQRDTRGFAVTYDSHQVHAIIALPGDANLDRTVDGQDFIVWNANKFDSSKDWTTGDFNGDGRTDGQDFILWNSNKFTSVDTFVLIPEPGMSMLCLCLAPLMYRRWAGIAVESQGYDLSSLTP